MIGKVYTIPQFSQALSKLADNVRGDVIKKAALAGGFQIEAHGKLNVRDTFKQHTGMLLGKWETKVDETTSTSCKVHTSPLMVYARIQELGGVIRPTKSKYLAIPINAKRGTSPRNYSGLHFVQVDAGSGMMIDESGVAMFWLTKMVTIPARPYLRPAVDDNKDSVMGAIGGVLKKEIEGAI